MFKLHSVSDMKEQSSTSKGISKNEAVKEEIGNQALTGNSRPGTRSRISSIVSHLGERDSLTADNSQNERFSMRHLAKMYATRGFRGDTKTSRDDHSEQSSLRLDKEKVQAMKDSNRCSSLKNQTFLEDNTQEKIHFSERNLVSDFRNLEVENQENAISTTTEDIMRASLKSSSDSVERIPLNLSNSKRTIVLGGFETMTFDLTTILAQVCGGPLEKVTVCSEGSENMTVGLSFFKISDAAKFMEYARTGMFLINGCSIQACFAIEDNPKEVSSSIREAMSVKGARRCLILKKDVKAVQKSLKNNLNSRMILAEFDASSTRKDFEKFGAIVEVAAVISKRLSFAVHFYDTRSAIEARSELETAGSEMNLKYHDWSIWYGKDPCDKPCYAL